MRKFKVGDKVRRVYGDFSNVKKGEVYTVSSGGVYTITLLEADGVYDTKKFDLIKEKKWHPHHDLIIEWLENEDAVVEFKSRYTEHWVVLEEPLWHTQDVYRITYPNKERENKISKIEAEMRKLADELKELKNDNA